MPTVKYADLVESIAAALQYISYTTPRIYIAHLGGPVYQTEQSLAAKDAIAQILTNSRMCAEGHRPICQDTGIVNVFVENRHGRALRGLRTGGSIEDAVNEGVRRATSTRTTAARVDRRRPDLRAKEHRRTTRRPSCT